MNKLLDRKATWVAIFLVLTLLAWTAQVNFFWDHESALGTLATATGDDEFFSHMLQLAGKLPIAALFLVTGLLALAAPAAALTVLGNDESAGL